MIMESRSNINPSVLPSSPRAAVYHGLRVYHQIKVWLLLMNTNCDPMKWGWKMNNGLFSPIMTDTEPGPQDLWCDAIAKNLVTKGVILERLAWNVPACVVYVLVFFVIMLWMSRIQMTKMETTFQIWIF